MASSCTVALVCPIAKETDIGARRVRQSCIIWAEMAARTDKSQDTEAHVTLHFSSSTTYVMEILMQTTIYSSVVDHDQSRAPLEWFEN